MSLGLVGRKCGMTRVFLEDGNTVPVTVLHVIPNKITQLRTHENDGYNAVQVSYESGKAKNLNKSVSGHITKANLQSCTSMHEFRVENIEELNLGDEINLSLFESTLAVDISGKTRGKGFAGTVKRHNFRMQDASHGNSISHRVPGSIGQNQTPGRVFKGKKMSGHMGNVNRTSPNLEVHKIDLEKNLLLVKGSVPGAPGTEVIITPSVKRKS